MTSVSRLKGAGAIGFFSQTFQSSIRNRGQHALAFKNFLGYIQSAKAGSVLIKILIPVVAGTDQILVFLEAALGKPAGAAWIAIPLPIHQKTLCLKKFGGNV